MKRLFFILALLWIVPAWSAEVIPPAPEKYFNDYAHVTSQQTADRLNSELENFERQTSSQIVVAMYPKMQSDSSIEDYAVRVFRAWKIGQKDKNNGALLLIFVQDHKMNITTGYGLEGALPDAICKDIISDQIAPRFKQGDFDGGVSAGVAAMMAAVKGEYKGTGKTVADRRQNASSSGLSIVGTIFFFFIIYLIWRSISRGGGGRGGGGWGSAAGWMIGSAMSDWSRGGGGGGWSGGGGGGGGFSGGGFSGGGGSSGGGGASGSW